MIRKNEEQFDSGGIMLKHTFLLGFNDLDIPSEEVTEYMVNEFIQEKMEGFGQELKIFLMFKLGYIGTDESGKWIKEEKSS